MDKGSKSLAALVASVGTICAFGGYSLLTSDGVRGQGDLSKQLLAAKKAGMPVDMADIQAPPVPLEQNAAPIYLQADRIAKQLSKPQAVLDSEVSLDSKPPSPEGDKAVRDLEPLYSELALVEARPKCDFQRDWSLGAKLILPEFSGMKRDVRDLCRKADLQDRTGDMEGEFKSMDLAYRIAVHAGCDPIIISLLVDNAAQGIVTREWTRIVERHSHDDRFLEKVQVAVQAQGALPQVRKYLGGEVVMGRRTIETMTSMADLTGTENSNISAALINAPGMRSLFEASYLDHWSKAWKQFPADPNDWAGYSAVLRGMEVDIQQDSSIGNSLNQILMPVFTAAGDSVGVQLAHWRLLNTSIALLRLRNATGHFPAVLPAKLARIDTDPFDGSPLRYRLQNGGFLLYSIGADRSDNGGISAADSKDSAGYDEVIEMS